jgi:flagellar biosynthesis protein FlhA
VASWWNKIDRHGELAMAGAVFAVLVILLAPLPPPVMDALLVVSVGMSLMFFLTTLTVQKTVQFTSFPTLLLASTVFRLSLNVASTRLILLNGHGGSHAAGRVIEAFGQFVVGGNFAVGVVVFCILVVINFVVITKGSGRVAEVAARFTLDAMPGKQMAIDAELNAGLINESDAKKRRREVSQEAEFYGAMDGASKFIRGDAIAGIIITVVNVLGGMFIGIVQNGMPAMEAAKVYTILTVGDGLVGQVPALVISTAAGVLVTRVADSDDSSLDDQVLGQLLGKPRVLAMSAVGLGCFGLIPGLRIPFMTAAVIVGYLAYRRWGSEARDAEQQAEVHAEEVPLGPSDLLNVDPLTIEVGLDLLYLVDESAAGALGERIQKIRNQFAKDLGVVLPSVHLTDDLALDSGEYVVRVRGEEVGRAKVRARKHLALDPGTATGVIRGIETVDPVYGLKAYWIPDGEVLKAQSKGYTVVDVPTVLTTHFVELMHAHAHELYDGNQLNNVLERLREVDEKLVDELIPDPLPRHTVLKVFRNLIREGLSVRDAQTVLEALADNASKSRDADVLTEFVRQRLARQITRRFSDDAGVLHFIGLGQDTESAILRGLQSREGSLPTLALQPAVLRILTQTVEELSKTSSGPQPILLAPPLARGPLRRLLERVVPRIAVVSSGELLPTVKLACIGKVELQATAEG